MRFITAYGVQCLVAGCWGSSAGQQAMLPGRGMLHDISMHMQRSTDKHTSSCTSFEISCLSKQLKYINSN